MSLTKKAATSFSKAYGDPSEYLLYLHDDLRKLGFTDKQSDEIIELWGMAHKSLSLHDFFEFHTLVHQADTRETVTRKAEKLSYKIAEKLNIPIAPLAPAYATTQYQPQSWLAPRQIP
ncbi:MAG: hypothetical protein ACRBCT_00040 [Alphaproteobacteria bacterium]